ncbi:integrase, catalytic region, zinc finger, CCHC-type containing protein [Tanacetum coccineum]
MYKVVITQESQTNEAKNGLSYTGMNDASSVRRLMNKDSHVKNSVLANFKNSAKKVTVYVRKNKQTNDTSANVISNKENVIDANVANASKAKTLLCVSCMENMLIPCHDKFSKPKIDVGSISKVKHKVVQIILWNVDSGCSKHMTGDRSLLRNFIEKFMGIVRFGIDNFAAITGYNDYMQGNITICHVYYVEGGREYNFYTISISDMVASSLICLMSKATSTKSWLWHRRLSHLNFGTINDLTRLDLVDGLPKFKYGKDHICSAYERGKKSKKASHPPKLVPSDHSKLELLHMDLCGPMRVYFLHSKDETLEIIKKFIAQAQLNYKAKVCKIRTDNADTLNTPSKEDLDNLFGPMFEEYFEKRSFDTPINFTAQLTQFHEDSSSISSIIVEEHNAPPIETTFEEQTSPISLTNADEVNQEDSANFNGKLDFVPYNASSHEEIKSSMAALEP